MGTKVQQNDDSAAAAAAAATPAAEAAATHSNANATTTQTTTAAAAATTKTMKEADNTERATTPTQITATEHNSKTLPTHATTATTTTKTTTTSTVAATCMAPTASPAPQVLIIPAAQASTMATNAAKKIRRAFSMPRNPFRWSRKFKTVAGSAGSASGSEINGGSGGGVDSSTAISSCMSGGRGGRRGSIVSLNSYKAASIDAPLTMLNEDKDAIIQNKSATIATVTGSGSNNSSSNNNNDSSSGKRAAGQNARVMRRSSFRKFINRIAQHLSARVNVGANKHGMGNASGTERVPPIGGYQWPADQTPGVMGLKNHGNTCFMNAVLQCLSHTDILAEYFVLDQYKADLKRRNKINSRKFGTKGELTEQLANVLKALWTCRNESDHSTSFKAVVDRYGTQFRSSTQHDAQEFLFWLLDKVHEDLNTASKRRYKSIKNSYGRSDEIIAAETLANHIRCNNSFVQAVFQAQFRSSLTCPRCQKQSNTFDPFHCISVQLPQLTQLTVFVTVVFMKQQPRQLKMGLRVPAGSPIVVLREQLQETGIAANRMVLVDLNAEGFTRVFYDTQPVETLSSVENIYCIEVPEIKESTPKSALEAAPATATDAPAEEKSTPAAPATAAHSTDLLLLVANVHKKEAEGEASAVCTRFGAPFSMKAPRDCSYQELQKRMLREMSSLLKPEVFSYATPLTDMFKIRLQDPSADPDTYLEQVEHPLLTEMIDMALSVLSSEAGPTHIKLLLEWTAPEAHFVNVKSDADAVVEHESVARLSASKPNDTAALTLEQCLEHYTKAETLSAEDAWRCPHCQQYLPVVKTLGLWSLPDILVVHFKRFRQHQAKGPQAAKLTTMVKFPLTAFDMSPHLARGVRENSGGSSLSQGMDQQHSHKKSRGDSRSSTLNSRAEPKDTRYDLYAVCYHQGDTLETGHYTAACKNPYDRQWYKFDDQRVSKVPEDDIEQDIINNEAYMLFYQRRTADASAECSGSSSNSGDHWVSRIAPPAATVASTSTTTANGSKEKDSAEIVEAISAPTEKAVSKPVAIPPIPKVTCEIEDVASLPEEKSSAVELPSHEVLNIEELAYADADADPVTDAQQAVITAEPSVVNKVDPDVMQTVTPTSPTIVEEVTTAAVDADASQIFAMDEDSAEKQPPSVEAVNGDAAVPLCTAEVTNESISLTQEPKTNGHAASSGTSSASSSASSVSSLSSRSSPRSLSTSVTAASTLQNKFNGHMNAASAAAALLNGNAAPQLSSSLQLSRHALHNHCTPNWHGSRSSVSAVESVTQHQQQQQQQQAAAASLSLRHSFSTSSNYKLRECSETLSSLLRNSANTCSKDTLLFIDQQNHHHTSGLIEDDDDTYMGRSLWISPVTPHKLITVSPKN